MTATGSHINSYSLRGAQPPGEGFFSVPSVPAPIYFPLTTGKGADGNTGSFFYSAYGILAGEVCCAGTAPSGRLAPPLLGLLTLHQRLQAQDRVALLGEPVQQLLAVGGDGLVSDIIAEVVDAVEFLSGLVQPLGHIVLQLLGHPDDPLNAALGCSKLLGGNKVTAMAHITGGLNAAAGAGGQFAEGHTGRGHALVFPVDHDDTVAHGLNAANALEAAARGHGGNTIGA